MIGGQDHSLVESVESLQCTEAQAAVYQSAKDLRCLAPVSQDKLGNCRESGKTP